MAKKTNNPSVRKSKQNAIPQAHLEEIGGWTKMRYAVCPLGREASEVPGSTAEQVTSLEELPRLALPKGASLKQVMKFLRGSRLVRDGQ